MLRVRPTLHTAHVAEWSELFTALGLAEMSRPPAAMVAGRAGIRCFAAGSGRIMLQEATGFDTELLLEVRDLGKFASWTAGDGTPVSLQPEEAATGSPALGRITAPDGLAFTALGVDPTDTAGTPRNESGSLALPEGQLAVLALWHTPDVPGARSTLENIGTKPDTISSNGAWAKYRAKHGGFVAAHAADMPRVELSLEYAGNIEVLANRLSPAGLALRLVDEAYGRTLLVDHPDGGQLWINERQLDMYGYARH